MSIKRKEKYRWMIIWRHNPFNIKTVVKQNQLQEPGRKYWNPWSRSCISLPASVFLVFQRPLGGCSPSGSEHVSSSRHHQRNCPPWLQSDRHWSAQTRGRSANKRRFSGCSATVMLFLFPLYCRRICLSMEPAWNQISHTPWHQTSWKASVWGSLQIIMLEIQWVFHGLSTFRTMWDCYYAWWP